MDIWQTVFFVIIIIFLLLLSIVISYVSFMAVIWRIKVYIIVWRLLGSHSQNVLFNKYLHAESKFLIFS